MACFRHDCIFVIINLCADKTSRTRASLSSPLRKATIRPVLLAHLIGNHLWLSAIVKPANIVHFLSGRVQVDKAPHMLQELVIITIKPFDEPIVKKCLLG